MKRKNKSLPRERNVFVAAAMFRQAGAHTKSNKAKRKGDKQRFKRELRGDSDWKDAFEDAPLQML